MMTFALDEVRMTKTLGEKIYEIFSKALGDNPSAEKLASEFLAAIDMAVDLAVSKWRNLCVTKQAVIDELGSENQRLKLSLKEGRNTNIDTNNADATSADQYLAKLTELFVDGLSDKNPNAEVLTIEFKHAIEMLQAFISKQKANHDTGIESLKAEIAARELEINLLNGICSGKLGLEDAAAFLRSQNPYRDAIKNVLKIQANHDEMVAMQRPIIEAARNAVSDANEEVKIRKINEQKQKTTAGAEGGKAKGDAYEPRNKQLKEYYEANIKGKGSAIYEANIMIGRDEVKKIISDFPNLKALEVTGLKKLIEEKWRKQFPR
jgi:hypothetical protein